MQITVEPVRRGPTSARGRWVRRTAAIAVVAGAPLLLAGSCSSTVSFARPLIDEGGRERDRRIEGEWVRADTTVGDHWAVRFDSGSVEYAIAIAPPAMARRFLSIELAFPTDSATLRRLRRDPSARARRASDSTAMYRLGDDSAGPRLAIARLGRLDSVLMIDVTPAGMRAAPRLSGLRVDVHAIWRLTVGATELRLVPLNGAWLERMLDSSRISLAHVTIGGLQDGTLITASTVELHHALGPFARDTVAFRERDAIVLRRPPVRATSPRTVRKP